MVERYVVLVYLKVIMFVDVLLEYCLRFKFVIDVIV